MSWFRRRSKPATSGGQTEAEESYEIGGDRIVFWKSKEQDEDGTDYGPVWIADANDPDVRLEEPDLWLTWEQAEEFARKRGLPLEDV
jgi:hypothetical protein